jgi:sn1-specific diacylglycerol lipase
MRPAGSLSIDDVVRDLLFEPSDVDAWVQGGRAWGDPLPPLRPAAAATRFAAHAGILEAARATLDDVRAGGHLLDLLHGPTARCAGYRLVVAGHSLGAGVAFLASLHLRHYFPGLRCFAFSPPGGLATAELCAGAAGWCTSSVCGKEWIPRLTVATFERMRDGMVMAAARCRRPKLAVAWGWARGRAWRERELFYAPGDVPDEPMDWLRRYEASLEATRAARGWAERAANFGPPGRVMHLRPTGVVGPRADAAADGGAAGTRKRGGKGGGTARQYTAVWVDSQAVVDEGILLSSRMMADHMPDYCLAVLRRLADAAARHQAAAEVADAGGRGAVEGAVSLAQAVAAGRAHSATDAGEHGHPPGRGGPRERGRREE